MHKKVMIAQALLGGGHLSVAQSISQALQDIDPKIEINLVDIFSTSCSKFPLTMIPYLYSLITTKHSILWRLLYQSTNNQQSIRFAERIAQPFIQNGFRKMVKDYRPDVIVFVFPALGYLISKVLQDFEWSVKIVVVVTDLVSIHSAWTYPNAHKYAVPTRKALNTITTYGIAQERITISGLPIRKEFLSCTATKQALKSKLLLSPKYPLVLLSTGGDGMNQIDELIRVILSSNIICQLAVITGKNSRMYRKLQHSSFSKSCVVLGFINNMAEWMWAADVLISKAGPTTIVEAISCRLPIIINGSIPGQEDGNVDYVISNKFGFFASNPWEVQLAVENVLTDSALVKSVRDRLENISLPNSSVEVAKLILNCD